MATREHGSVLLGRHIAQQPKGLNSHASFGARIGRSQQQVNKYVNGVEAPVELETLLSIEAESDGAVPVESWLPARLLPRFEMWVLEKAQQIISRRPPRRSRRSARAA